jgi:hypothetical protein
MAWGTWCVARRRPIGSGHQDVTTIDQARRDIKAIPTKFDGLRYRSRLEARYEDAFKYMRDHGLNAGTLYEPQGYEVDGKAYLPDFLLPEQALIAEVKPSLDADPDGVARWIALIEARQKERGVLLTDMHAGPTEFLLIGPDGNGGHWECDTAIWLVCPGGYHLDIQPYPPIGCDRCRLDDGYWYEDERITQAFNHARSYRFGR